MHRLLLAVIGGMTGYILWASGAVRPVEWGWLPAAAWAGPVGAAALAAVGAGVPGLVGARGE